MSMQLRIAHTTHYEYAGPAVASYNQARLTPLTTPEQIAVHTRLEVSPQPWSLEAVARQSVQGSGWNQCSWV